MMRLLVFARTAVIVALVAYLLIFTLLAVFQRSFVYQPDTRKVTPQQAKLQGFEAVQTAPGQFSWWHAPTDASAPVILHLHGNGGALAGRASIFADMASWGSGVLAVGYPGYGGNAGTPNEADIHRAAQANYDWLIAQGVDPARIVISAHSMGTGAAVPLAVKNKAAGLILEAPFTSLLEVAQREMWMFPVSLVLKDQFRSTDHIRAVRIPLVWVHGTADKLIPYEMGETLYDMVPGPKCYLRIDVGDHDNLWKLGTRAFTQRQAFAMAQTGACDQTPVLLQEGELIPG